MEARLKVSKREALSSLVLLVPVVMIVATLHASQATTRTPAAVIGDGSKCESGLRIRTEHRVEALHVAGDHDHACQLRAEQERAIGMRARRNIRAGASIR
jgi:hypothetical protein